MRPHEIKTDRTTPYATDRTPIAPVAPKPGVFHSDSILCLEEFDTREVQLDQVKGSVIRPFQSCTAEVLSHGSCVAGFRPAPTGDLNRRHASCGMDLRIGSRTRSKSTDCSAPGANAHLGRRHSPGRPQTPSPLFRILATGILAASSTIPTRSPSESRHTLPLLLPLRRSIRCSTMPCPAFSCRWKRWGRLLMRTPPFNGANTSAPLSPMLSASRLKALHATSRSLATAQEIISFVWQIGRPRCRKVPRSGSVR